MSVDPVHILSAPFDRDLLEVPQGRIVFFNAQAFAETSLQPFADSMDCIQSLRPHYLKLQNQGANIFPEFEAIDASGGKHDAAFVLASKHRGLNEAHIAKAVKSTKTGGLIVVAGEKTSGIASLRKALASQLEITDSMSKYHGVVFWFYNPGKALDWQEETTRIDLGNGLVAETRPGIFSHGKIDSGSKLLASHFGDKIGGAVADFGSGWGYLGAEALHRCPNITTLDCFEADHSALQASEKLLAKIDSKASLQFHWHDLCSEPVKRQFDWVIMNPPFHDGRNSNVELGQYFIQRAGEALRAHGKMLMVANNHLAYERKLEAVFPKFETIDQQGGFKIIKAWR